MLLGPSAMSAMVGSERVGLPHEREGRVTGVSARFDYELSEVSSASDHRDFALLDHRRVLPGELARSRAVTAPGRWGAGRGFEMNRHFYIDFRRA